jgi:hypothetical protein
VADDSGFGHAVIHRAVKDVQVGSANAAMRNANFGSILNVNA